LSALRHAGLLPRLLYEKDLVVGLHGARVSSGCMTGDSNVWRASHQPQNPVGTREFNQSLRE